LQLTDELIRMTVNNITGYLVATIAKEENRDIETVMTEFLSSKTYSMLADKNTGLYWDSMAATEEMYMNERVHSDKG